MHDFLPICRAYEGAEFLLNKSALSRSVLFSFLVFIWLLLILRSHKICKI